MTISTSRTGARRYPRLVLPIAAALALAPVAALSASAATSTGDRAVSVDTAYVKANGRAITSTDAISACGTNRRQQNELSRQAQTPQRAEQAGKKLSHGTSGA